MMGKQRDAQRALFYHRFNLERRVRADHPLRTIEAIVDFDFVYPEVAHVYGRNGNESVPPPVILKLMFLLAFYNVRSERELMEMLPERLDWLWFLRFDIDTPIPDHSVLSKARRRWGVAVFRALFERVIEQCKAAGLVQDGTIYCDSSLIEANASVDSIVTAACIRLEGEGSAAATADAADETETGDSAIEDAPRRKAFSTTDPDAAVVKRGPGRAKPRYKTHRAVNENGVITATKTTAGDVADGDLLMELIDQHQSNTSAVVSAAVGDSHYGTVANLLACKDRGIDPHMSVRRVVRDIAAERELLPETMFIYSPATDTYECPNSATLRRAGKADKWGLIPYNASSRDCRDCPAKQLCTTTTKRTVRRHQRHDAVRELIKDTQTDRARRHLARRRYLIEGSFGRATRYGFKRARYRGADRVQMQDLLIATVQNVMVLCRHLKRPTAGAILMTLQTIGKVMQGAPSPLGAWRVYITMAFAELVSGSCPPRAYC